VTIISGHERLKELGFEGALRPMTVSCADHEGTIQAASRPGKITSVWHVSDDSVIDPMVREARPTSRPKRRSRPAACWRT